MRRRKNLIMTVKFSQLFDKLLLNLRNQKKKRRMSSLLIRKDEEGRVAVSVDAMTKLHEVRTADRVRHR